MRRRGPREGPVQPHRPRRGAVRASRATPARARSSGASRPGDRLRLFGRGSAGLRHRYLRLALLDARRLAGEMAQVVELGATNAAAAHDLDVGEHRAVEGEDALDPDAVGDLANGEGGTDARTPSSDAHA